jgi:hypothetical protein
LEKRKPARIVWCLIFSMVPMFAQAQNNILPDKPEPQFAEHVHGRTADREFWVASASVGTGWLLDTLSTSQSFNWCNQHHRTGCVESGVFFNGTRSTAKIGGTLAALDVAAIVASYEWKKHVHNKWLHPLWRVPLLYSSQAHTRAAIGNWKTLNRTKAAI